MKDDAEYYFIQLLFTRNPGLLRKEGRELYDAMLIIYEKIYAEGRKAKIDGWKIINIRVGKNQSWVRVVKVNQKRKLTEKRIKD